jgi:hypothetical protein
VVGTLRNVQKNVITLAAGPQPMQIELAPDATITVTASDFSFASHGDLVTVSGLRNPAQPEWIQAERIDVKAAKKLTQAQPVPRGGKLRANGRGRGGAADAKDLQDNDAPAANDKPGNGKAGRKPTANERRPAAPGR